MRAITLNLHFSTSSVIPRLSSLICLRVLCVLCGESFRHLAGMHGERIVHHRHRHGRRQDVCRGADCAGAARSRASASASTSRWPAAANAATASWFRRMRSRLWEAAGRPGSLEQVCPQMFAAPLAPHLAARAEGRRVDPQLLRDGIDVLARDERHRARGRRRRTDVADERRRLQRRSGGRVWLSARGRRSQRAGHDQRDAADADHGEHVLRRARRRRHRAQFADAPR